jgi:hypothetical protein
MKVIKNIRCPICGDSKLNPSTKRGFVVELTQSRFYICHNNTPMTSCPANDPIPVHKLKEYKEIS